MISQADISRRSFLQGASAVITGTAFCPKQTFGAQASSVVSRFEMGVQLLGQRVNLARTEEDWTALQTSASQLISQRTPEEIFHLDQQFAERGMEVQSLGCAYLLFFLNRRSNYNVVNMARRFYRLGNLTSCRRFLEHSIQSFSPNDMAINEGAISDLLQRVTTRSYLIEWIIDWRRNIPFKGNNEEVSFCPVYDRRPFQESSYRVIGSGGSTTITEGENTFLSLRPGDDRRMLIRNIVTQIPTDFRPMVREFEDRDIPASVRRYLSSCDTVNINDPVVRDIANTLKKDSMIDSIENVFKWCNREIKGNPHGRGDLVSVLTLGSPQCEGFTTAAVGLLRAIGVPARYIRGWGGIVGRPLNNTSEIHPVPVPHTFTEFYIPSVGWLEWDGNVPPFISPASFCMGTYRYFRPQAGVNGQGDVETQHLWNAQAWPDASSNDSSLGDSKRCTLLYQTLSATQ